LHQGESPTIRCRPGGDYPGNVQGWGCECVFHSSSVCCLCRTLFQTKTLQCRTL